MPASCISAVFICEAFSVSAISAMPWLSHAVSVRSPLYLLSMIGLLCFVFCQFEASYVSAVYVRSTKSFCVSVRPPKASSVRTPLSWMSLCVILSFPSAVSVRSHCLCFLGDASFVSARLSLSFRGILSLWVLSLLIPERISIKGTVAWYFEVGFFHQTTPPGPIRGSLEPF